ncbi:hypothetical protein [Paenibacillus sp. YYML68]|uniref:hypothetical protein n=1 Tax=Paenibacillus sp. YYML68 TaxID=2909250 RepID=UPI0024939D33|nr:hypothetical protein [Paenibacillus sp. YYML68]
MLLMVEFAMWLLLFASITLVFSSMLLEMVLRDTAKYDMEHHWNHRFTYKDLHLDPDSRTRE